MRATAKRRSGRKSSGQRHLQINPTIRSPAAADIDVRAPGYVGNDHLGNFTHYCHCGAWASFGYGNLTQPTLSQWLCGEHRKEGPVPIIVTLSEVWRNKAIEAGKARHAHATTNGWQRYGNGPDNPASYNINGCIAEVAVAKHFRLPWRANIGVIDRIDVGDKIEVRGRPIPGPGPDLPIRPKDKDDLPYVLAHVIEADSTIRLVGWLYGHEGKDKPSIWDEACGCWWNPPPYRPISELVRQLAAERK